MSAVLDVVELGFPWQGHDPFLFTVHHRDDYPRGTEALGPAKSLTGRDLGSDFSYLDGWSMYHGLAVPGFPQHPHRGFETVTVVRRGYVDHSDSLGATARYGEGDVQWLTTGSGIMHAEMFPLVDPEQPNPLELFQIWLNLPPESKMVDAYFGMLWGEDIPTVTPAVGVTVDVIAGELGPHRPPSPPPDSWASRAASCLAIWLIRMEPGSTWRMPGGREGLSRMLHCFRGHDARVEGSEIEADVAVELDSGQSAVIESRGEPTELLMLQGRPIEAPVFQLGPFVMSSAGELQQAVEDYRRTGFGGWPWERADPVHPRAEGRFAIHADGTAERRDRHVAGITG